MRAAPIALCALVLALAQVARAQSKAGTKPGSAVIPAAPAGTAVVAPPTVAAEPHRRPAVAAKRAPRTPDPATVPPANVTLSLDVPTARGPWTFRITNNDAVPVRIVADGRFLSLDVTELGAAKARHCELPLDMRPKDPLERLLVIPPKQAYEERIEPRLFCFDGRSRDALTGQSVVVARLGHVEAFEATPIVSPIDGALPQVGGRRFLESAPIRLSDEPAPPGLRETATDTDVAALSLVAPESIDAESAESIEIPLTLKNVGSNPVVIRFRPELIRFEAARGSGAERCVWPVVTAAPTPELFATLPARRGTIELTVDLGAYCLGSILDRSGLLRVWARLDTRTGSGEIIGIRSFDGQVAAASPTLVRLHRGRTAEPFGHPNLAKP